MKNMVRLAVDSGIRRLKFHRLSLAGRIDLPMVSESVENEVRELREFLDGWPVCASFTRTRSSSQKRLGYWVAKPPGVLTNSDVSARLDSSQEVRDCISQFLSTSKSLVS